MSDKERQAAPTMRRRQVLILETSVPDIHARVIGEDVIGRLHLPPARSYREPAVAPLHGWRLLGPPVRRQDHSKIHVAEVWEWWFEREEPRPVNADA